MHTAVVVTAVALMSRFRLRFLKASARKNPRLSDPIGVASPCPVADYMPRLQRHDPLAHHVDHLLVVCRYEDRGADAVDPVQKLHNAHAGIRIEVSRGLV